MIGNLRELALSTDSSAHRPAIGITERSDLLAISISIFGYARKLEVS